MATTVEKLLLSELYVAFFNRAPDSEGFTYWLERIESGSMTLQAMASNWWNWQAETQATYPSSLTTDDFVEKIYTNVLGRDTDPGGKAYWVERITSGAILRENFIMAVIDGAKAPTGGANDRQYLANKAEVGVYFAEQGAPASQAIQIMTTIISDSGSVTAAKTSIDTLVAEAICPLVIQASELSLSIETVGSFPTASTYGVSALDEGSHWSSNDITYSFNLTMPSIYNNNPWYYPGWMPLSATQQTTVRTIMAEVGSLLDLTFSETANGQIRFNLITPPVATYGGFSQYPGTEETDGDIWLNSNYYNSNASIDKSEMAWFVTVHELGHALGLKHPFEGTITLPTTLDDMFHSIMSYTYIKNLIPVINASEFTLTNVYPHLYSLYDISALQSIYGANLTTRTGDDTYSVDSVTGDIITIWDAGGEDTIDLSSSVGKSTIDLSSGTINSAGFLSADERMSLAEQNALAYGYTDADIDWLIGYMQDNEAALYTGENNLGIAVGTIIENLKTGAGDDTITDNLVDNVIFSGAGNDKIYISNGGYDTIDGGLGIDTVYIDLALSDLQYARGISGYCIVGQEFAAKLYNIENIILADGILRDITFIV